MHEARLCLSLLRLAEAALAREGGRQIVRVDLEVGELSGVSPVALQTAFPICARGTAAEGAELRWQRSGGRELLLRSMEVV